MCCPECGASTEVSQKRGPFRDRVCTNVLCRYEFTTCENILTQPAHHRLCAKTLALRFARPNPPSSNAPAAASQPPLSI